MQHFSKCVCVCMPSLQIPALKKAGIVIWIQSMKRKDSVLKYPLDFILLMFWGNADAFKWSICFVSLDRRLTRNQDKMDSFFLPSGVTNGSITHYTILLGGRSLSLGCKHDFWSCREWQQVWLNPQDCRQIGEWQWWHSGITTKSLGLLCLIIVNNIDLLIFTRTTLRMHLIHEWTSKVAIKMLPKVSLQNVITSK